MAAVVPIGRTGRAGSTGVRIRASGPGAAAGADIGVVLAGPDWSSGSADTVGTVAVVITGLLTLG